MMSTLSILNANDIKDISSELLQDNGKMKILSANDYKKYRWQDFRHFCHVHARYGIPTTELIDFLITTIAGRSVIEIGAGCGDLGYLVGATMTDNKQQEMPEIRRSYEAVGQPVIKYPRDVEKIDALDAVKKYKPQVVIGCWVTVYAPHEMPYGSSPYGIKENELLNLVETYIVIGNHDMHGDKPIRKLDHLVFQPEWLVSRAKNQKNNCIYIWNKK